MLVPLIALTALGGFDAAARRREADAAADIEAQLARGDRALRVYTNLMGEKTASQTMVMATSFGFSAAQASSLLGIDMTRQLRATRAALDAALATDAGRPLAAERRDLSALRARVDAGTATAEDVRNLFGRYVGIAESAWLGQVRRVSRLTFETPGSAAVRKAATVLQSAAEALASGSNETAAAAAVTVPGMPDAVTARQDLAADAALYEHAVSSFRPSLGTRGRAAWTQWIVDDRDVQTFEGTVTRLLDGSARPATTTDITGLASLFHSGLTRQDRLAQVVAAAASDVTDLARSLRAALQRDLVRYTVELVALVTLSVLLAAVTARSIVRPLRRLARRASDVSAGVIGGPSLEPRGPREVAVVSEAFNETVANLRALEAEALALAAADFENPVLRSAVPGRIGESLQHSVDRLSQSIRDNEELRRSLARNEARFRALVQHADDLIAILDGEGRIAYQSPSIETVLGHAGDETAGTHVHEYLRPEHAADVDVLIQRARLAGGAVQFATEIRDHDGRWRNVEGSATEMFSVPEVGGLVLNARDVTARVQAEQTIRDAEERFRLLFASNPVPMWVYDAKTLAFLEVNDAAVRAYGYSHDEFLQRRVTDVRPTEDVDALLRSPSGSPLAASHDGVARHVTRDGRIVEVNTTSRLLDFAGRPAVLVMAEDATERLAAERALTYQAMHDALTGLPNRVLLLDRLEQAINRTRRSGVRLAVVFVDLDHFKVVNDAKGHTIGDKLLVEVAARIRAAVRPEDTVARFGGDEFVVVLEGISGADEAAAICDRIRHSLGEPFRIAGSDLVVTASQGIALAGADDSADDLLRTADAAMYSAKERGRGRSEIADHAIRTRATRRLEVEAAIRRGLDAGEFVTYFQPIVALSDGAIIGGEALLRWDDPQRGLILPDQFIPIAEETGLIAPLGQHVLERALHDASSWPAITPGRARPFVSVNVSGRQLVIPDLPAVIARAISDARVDADRVHLEITESVLMRDIDRSASSLATIAALGVHLSIDDFGTGYSSLAYLQRLPIDTLKVDRSFVELLDRDGRDASIVAAVLNLARALRLDVIAEGVETAAQADELKRLGCGSAQGFYFARPVPAAEFAVLLRERPRLGSRPERALEPTPRS